ncbi:putative reverse transcriptase domain-containing protein [Tanacetum coccineum]
MPMYMLGGQPLKSILKSNPNKKRVSNVVGDVPGVKIGKENNNEDEDVIMDGRSKAAGVSFASMVSEPESVMSRYANTLVGYFVGKSLAFQIVQNYVNNTWAKFGLSKLIKTDNGVFLFKFDTKSGMDQVIERGPWLICNTPLILNKWAPNILLKPGEGRISFARALIEIHANLELKKEVRMAILIDNDDGTGYTSEVSAAAPTINTLANDGFTKVQKKSDRSKGRSNAISTSGMAKGGDKLKVNVCDPSGQNPKVSEHVGCGSSKADDDKIQEKDNLWSRFQRSKKDLLSRDDSDDEFEVEEYPPYNSTWISSTSGGFSLEDDDLDCMTNMKLRFITYEENHRLFVIIMIFV